ncbi:glycosyl hydrolase family 61-domain-containing protein [Phialemonium atrogriseum]|uniref:lytic cellulose monooxygenase (C4-dehydrogenating) n=1 Tax=Phialemonium atrogriseum TaxID=1093897 RepID=A0AAJ0FS12_9PEZI|nr:glycosyl hydrolase family 61-domain-containing protein [Phialemonium atrogriseum]KAK1772798.1 glycosyl hydrolase family 61-domain-containing protein [Phialemonium atrogriseum]
MHSALISVLAMAMATCVSGHATMHGVWVNGKDQGDGRSVYIRSPPNNSPVKDLASPDLVCNVNGAKAVSGFVKAAAGDTLSFEWFHDNRNDDIIDGSHKGPVITWIAKYTEGAGTGAIWSKIAEDGFDGSEWAVDKLIRNQGKQDFTLPSSLAAGKYLIRQEIIALHESDAAFNQNPARGAQFYPSCVQVEVTGSGSVVPNQKFDFNVDYTYADPGILFNLYTSFTSYPIPGPEVFSGSGSSPDTSSSTSSPSATATQSSAQASLPTTTLATVVTSASAVPATTEGSTAPVSTASPPSSCSSSRRRRRRANKNAKRSIRKDAL